MMKRLGLYAATIAMTGAFGISSQAGMGILAAGGNSSSGQNPVYSGSFLGGNWGGSMWSGNGNQGNCSSNVFKNSVFGSGSQNDTTQNSGWSTGNFNFVLGNGSFCPDNSFSGNNWADILCPGVLVPGDSCPDPSFPNFGNINGDCANPNWPDFICPDKENPGETKPDTENPGDNTPDTDIPDETLPGGQPNPDKPGNGSVGGNPGGGGAGGDNSGSVNPPNKDEEISEMIQQVIDLVNEERKKAGLTPLTESAPLMNAAAVRAQEITKSFSHTRPDGTSFSTAIRQSGAVFNGSGENIAYGQQTAEKVMNTWMNSQTHRANILKSQFTKIGVGCYIDSRGVKYWTQLFTY
jgi:hypothetical protein